jgi:hypothetical protein
MLKLGHTLIQVVTTPASTSLGLALTYNAHLQLTTVLQVLKAHHLQLT